MHRATARRGISTLAVLLGVATQSAAGPADVVTAVARCQGERCRFDVTVRHAPANVKRVRIRAHDSVHGHGGREQSLELER
jgi:hypothetical protein